MKTFVTCIALTVFASTAYAQDAALPTDATAQTVSTGKSCPSGRCPGKRMRSAVRKHRSKSFMARGPVRKALAKMGARAKQRQANRRSRRNR